jgi:hypothetical protein
VRLKPDGALDYRPAPRTPPAKPGAQMTYEERRQDLIDQVLHNRPLLTPEEAAEHIDAFY